MEEEEKKISLPEAIIMTIISGTGDLFGLVSGLSFPIPVIGQMLIFISFFVAITFFLIIQFWLIMKGVTSWWFAGGSIFDILTGGSLPLQTPMLLTAIFVANHPKLGKVAELAKGKVTK